MFTVKHEHGYGESTILASAYVAAQNYSLEVADPAFVSLFDRRPRKVPPQTLEDLFPQTVFEDGIVYVMNEKGTTVSKYDLDKMNKDKLLRYGKAPWEDATVPAEDQNELLVQRGQTKIDD